MTEQVHGANVSDDAPDHDEAVDGSEATFDDQAVRTGVTEVDGVLADVEALGDAPLEQHVAVFEQAHDTLRGALDGRGRDASEPQPPA